ncbi:MAG: urea carboxylase [Fusobacteriales bacterium]|nr:MAG: urea carboxylase [Fusobacteriales bacterium]
MSRIKIQKAGLCTTIQDIGRIGYQQFGIPVSGVMDEFAFLVGNFLVESPKNNAVLEMQFMGSTIEFYVDMSIAITGADNSPKINNKEIKMWESINVKKGDILSFGNLKNALRTYVAFAGELDVPIINGSKSTLMKAKMGGLNGRKLNIGDEIKIINPRLTSKKNTFPQNLIPNYSHSNEIRVVLGPQDDYFKEEGISKFFESEYQITKDCDRMGMRLLGETIEHKEKADIISDAAVFGSIQVPGNGQPIILLADRQTTGGYTKIATVIKADLYKLGQMLPGDKIKFKKLSIEEAQEEYIKFYEKLNKIKELISESNILKLSEKQKNTYRKLFGKRRKNLI